MSIKLVGVNKLMRALDPERKEQNLRRVVQHYGNSLVEVMQKKAVFTKGYSLGATRQSIHCEFKDNGLTAEVGPETEYSGFLEFGTRFMDAQPFVQPALDEIKDKFETDLSKALRK